MPCGPTVNAEPSAAEVRTMADTPSVFGRGQSQRLLTGILEHILDNRASKRFAVLEKDLDTDEVRLKLFRDRTEAILRKTYIFNKSNFVGTERGSVKRHSKFPVLYWAIILTNETVLFQDARNTQTSSDFERWNDIMKELWRHQSWMVKPVYGISQSTEKEFVLHITKVSLALAHVNPPRNFLRWDVSEIREAKSKGKSFVFTVVSSNGNSGYYEVHTDKERQSSRIQEALLMQSYDIPNFVEFAGISAVDQVRRITNEPMVDKPLNSPTSSIASIASTASIDPTTLEQYHMSREDLHGNFSMECHLNSSFIQEQVHMSRQELLGNTPVPNLSEQNHRQEPHQPSPLRAPTHLPLDTTKKNTTPPSPSSSQGSPVTCNPRKRFQGPKLRTKPGMPPRTTSYMFGETSPTAVTKLFSSSTGNLRDMSPPIHYAQRLSGCSSGNNSPVSAKSLPLPNIPPHFPGRSSPFFPHPKPPSIDENSVYTGSNSSLTSQDLSPTLSIPSSTSLSDEEPRFPATNTQQSSPTKEHSRSNSDVGPSLVSKGPYQRSTSTPPSLVGHTVDSSQFYINVYDADPVYINVSKKDDVYQNPPIFHPEHEPKNELPLPPRRTATTAKPDLPPRRPRSLHGRPHTEVSDILDDILKNYRLEGSGLGMSYPIYNKLCFDMDRDNQLQSELKNWKGLALQIGIEKTSDIQMIDAFSKRHTKSPTDIVLYYWHCQIQPQKAHSMEQLKEIMTDLERQDILEILS